MISTLIAIIIAYFLGSFSTSIVVLKITKGIDPREEGSGNAGTTNVLRLAGGKAAALTLAGDVLKGVLAVLIGWAFTRNPFYISLVGVAVYLGHVFPIFHQFKGGKGVATGFGALLTMSPLVGLIVVIIWAVVVAIFRYSSLAALVAYLTAPFLILFISNPAYFIGVAILTAFVFWRHLGNIERLRNHTEPKIEFGKK